MLCSHKKCMQAVLIIQHTMAGDVPVCNDPENLLSCSDSLNKLLTNGNTTNLKLLDDKEEGEEVERVEGSWAKQQSFSFPTWIMVFLMQM